MEETLTVSLAHVYRRGLLTGHVAYIAAQSSVAITAVGAASYLTICVPVFEILGVRTMGIGGRSGC